MTLVLISLCMFVAVPLPSVSIHTGPERVVLEGTNFSLSCDPPENAVLVLNTTSLGAGSSSSLGAVSRDSTGFYQCLSTGGAAASADDSVVAVGTVYLLVTCKFILRAGREGGLIGRKGREGG